MTNVPNYSNSANLNADSEVLPLDLLNAPQVILGAVNTTGPGDGRIQRLLPLAHPQWPWLYANNIVSVRGIGECVKFNSISPLEAEPMPAFALYPVYEFVIEFGSVPYAVLSDDDIETATFTTPWVDVNNQAAAEQTYATEWWRFTDYQVVPQNDWLTGTIGSSTVFQTEGGSGDKTTDPGAKGGAVFPAMPRILLPNEIIRLVWHMVPWRFYSSPNSYLRRFRGRINQLPWYDWDAGELLYMGASPLRFTPPILQPVNWLHGSVTVGKWCDLELSFIGTKRNGVNLPSSLPNDNYLAAGHNLLPWQGDNQFYYARSLPTQFPSFFRSRFSCYSRTRIRARMPSPMKAARRKSTRPKTSTYWSEFRTAARLHGRHVDGCGISRISRFSPAGSLVRTRPSGW
jgi:hypothetical protein